MPELPEVETIKRYLATRIIGKSFTGLTLHWPKAVQIPSAEGFERGLAGQRIQAIDRRGKYLILRLSHGRSLVIHFRMSGALLVGSNGESDPYIRAVFHLDDGTTLYLRDPRKLGRMWLVEDENEVLGKLGPEPFDPDLTATAFRDMLVKRSAPIKAVLIDQGFLAGVGNMYADEALFAATIHPLRPANSLSAEEAGRLHTVLRQILEESIASSGASINDYRRPDGQLGTAQFVFKVAHRLNQPCPVCTTPIERIVVRQRGTYFCPECQPYPDAI